MDLAWTIREVEVHRGSGNSLPEWQDPSRRSFVSRKLTSIAVHNKISHIKNCLDVGFAFRKKNFMQKQTLRRVTPLVLSPSPPYKAQGQDSTVLIWRRKKLHGLFENAFQTPISVLGWCPDGKILSAGSMTGEVLAWHVATGERVLANRHGHSYAPILGLSWSPSGWYLAAMTADFTIQVWQIATRTCLYVLPCSRQATRLKWSRDGSGFTTNDGLCWIDPLAQK